MDKGQVAKMLEEIGFMLEIKGESPFKSNAYYNAARTIEGLSEDLTEIVASGRIRSMKGIGQALSEKLAELVGTGRLAYYEELKRSVPSGLREMAAVPGLGPKKIAAIWNQLGITTLGELEYACIENRLVGLPGFGQKTQDKIRQGITQYKRRQGFHLYASAAEDAAGLVKALRSVSGIREVELVGALRRRLEVVNRIDVLVGAERTDPVLAGLRALDGLSELTARNGTITGKSPLGLPIEVVVVSRITPQALLRMTGNAEHLAALASRAADRGISWRLEPEGGRGADTLTPSADSEEALYERLGLPYIPPELREGMGEIEAAEAGRLGPLVEPDQIQGIFHNHTTASDGSATLDEMVAAAKQLGYRYIGISDHSQSAFYANGLKEDRIREQHSAIEALRKRVQDIAVFKGIEADILADGAMDYPDEVLARFDFVIASVHSRFNLSEEDQTRRVLKALANPYVTMLGHPTGRLLLSREGYRIDMHQVIEAA
ncbi:MAG: PHP domain-containing protein, partial [Nitrospirales bacterium]